MIWKPRIYYVYTHNNLKNRFRNGLKANTELSYWGIKGLTEAFGRRVKFLHAHREKGGRIARIRSKDIVIGHIGDTLTQASEQTDRLICFGPWSGHEDRLQKDRVNCVDFEWEASFYNRAASVILLTSEFNQRTYLEQPTNRWYSYFEELKKRGTRLRTVHQPIDFELFPRIKWAYTTNDFLYIGNTNHMKGVEDGEKLVEATGRILHQYGTGQKNLNHLDPQEVNRLPGLADFFIQPGMWEAQCVSILEAAARGFIPLVTPDTGYPYDHPYLLRYGDFEYNLNQIKKALALNYLQRKALADHLHHQLITDPKHNDWSQLTRALVEEVERLL